MLTGAITVFSMALRGLKKCTDTSTDPDAHVICSNDSTECGRILREFEMVRYKQFQYNAILYANF
jgi:hypothetical protein